MIPHKQTAVIPPPQSLPLSTAASASSGVKPGRYYLIANLPGYIYPLSHFAQDDLQRPTPEVKDRIATLLEPVVVVTANHTTAASLRLVRGATISGTVTYTRFRVIPQRAADEILRNYALEKIEMVNLS